MMKKLLLGLCIFFLLIVSVMANDYSFQQAPNHYRNDSGWYNSWPITNLWDGYLGTAVRGDTDGNVNLTYKKASDANEMLLNVFGAGYDVSNYSIPSSHSCWAMGENITIRVRHRSSVIPLITKMYVYCLNSTGWYKIYDGSPYDVVRVEDSHAWWHHANITLITPANNTYYNNNTMPSVFDWSRDYTSYNSNYTVEIINSLNHVTFNTTLTCDIINSSLYNGTNVAYHSSRATKSPAIYTIKTATGTHNITIPSLCYVQRPVQFKIHSTDSPNHILYCYNGSGWQNITNYTVVGSSIYEESINWNLANYNGICTQQSADVAVYCGGLGSGEYNYANNANDGDMSTYYTISLFSERLKTNYTKPIGAKNTSVIKIKYGGTAGRYFNLTPSKKCWNQNPLQFSLQVDNSVPYHIDVYCHNGTEFEYLGQSPDSISYWRVWEEYMLWDMEGDNYNNYCNQESVTDNNCGVASGEYSATGWTNTANLYDGSYSTYAYPSGANAYYYVNYSFPIPIAHHYKLDGNAQDSVGNNHGTEQDNVTYISGYFGQALNRSDEKGDNYGHVRITDFDDGEYYNDGLTVIAIVKPFSEANSVDDYVTNSYSFYGSRGWALQKYKWSPRFQFIVAKDDATHYTAISARDDSENYDTSRYYCLGGVLSGNHSSGGGYIALYRKDLTDGDVTWTNTTFSDDVRPWSSYDGGIGARFDGNNNFNGTIDEVMIYHSNLSFDQINSICAPYENYYVTGETCSDGILNGDETDVDCGGHCPACSEVEVPIANITDNDMNSWRVCHQGGCTLYNQFNNDNIAPTINSTTSTSTRYVINLNVTTYDLYLNWSNLSVIAPNGSVVYNNYTEMTASQSEYNFTGDVNVTWFDIGNYTIYVESQDNAGNTHNTSYTIDVLSWIRVHSVQYPSTMLETLQYQFNITLEWNGMTLSDNDLFVMLNSSQYSYNNPYQWYESSLSSTILNPARNATYEYNYTALTTSINNTEHNFTWIYTINKEDYVCSWSFPSGSGWAEEDFTYCYPEFNYTTKPINITIGDIDNCSTYSTRAINFTLYDEEDMSLMNGDIAAHITVYSNNQQKSYNLTWTNKDKFSVCINPASVNYTVDAQLEYSGTDTDVKTYYLHEHQLDSATDEIDLYLRNASDTTEVTFIVKDENDNVVPDVYININEYDLGTDTTHTSEIIKTNSNGEAVGHIILDTQRYNFVLLQDGSIVKQVSDLVITTPTMILTSYTYTFRVNLQSDFFDEYNIIRDVACSISFSNITKLFRYIFTDTSGSTTRGCLKVDKLMSGQHVTIYDNCVSSASSTIIYNISDSPGEYTYIGTGYVYIDDSKYLCGDPVEYNYNNKHKLFEEQGLFLSFLIILTMTFVGIASPIIAVIICCATIVLLSLFGLFHLSYGAIISLVIVGGMAIYRMNQK